MLYSHFRQDTCHNLPIKRVFKDDPPRKLAVILSEVYEFTIHKLRPLSEISKKIRTTRASSLAVISVMTLLCGAFAAYFVVSGRHLLGAWAVSVFLAWVFLHGATIATKRSARDKDTTGDVRPDDRMSTSIEFRSEAPDPKTSHRGSRQRRSADKFSPLAEARASKQSPPLWFKEGEKLSGRRTAAVSGRSRSRL